MKNTNQHLLNFALIAFFTFISFHISAQCFDQQDFSSPGKYTFTIPGSNDVQYKIEITTKGADGAPYMLGGSEFAKGGEGAFLKASYIVDGGSELTIFVGGAGFTGGSPSGGGGGGGTAVIINSTDVLIAAAAGGGGGNTYVGKGGLANTNSSPEGGTGVGAPGGGGFNEDGEDGQTGTGGKAGTLTDIGDGGIGGVVAGNGGKGFGGGGGGGGTAGGGGGGYKGGNGGIDGDLGGLGGDSFVNTEYSAIILANEGGTDGGSNKENGSVTIKCLFNIDADLLLTLVEKTDPTCFGYSNGEIVVLATGGLPPYEYSINGSDFSTNNTFSDLPAGTYTITVMDDFDDTDDISVTLEEPDELIGTVFSVVDNNCPDDENGEIEVEGSGGTSAYGEYQYSLDGGPLQSTGLFTNLANGEYVITIYDDNQCFVEIEEEINSPDGVEVSIASKTDVSCFGYSDGSITAQASSGTPPYTYSTDGVNYQNDATFNNLSAGNYTVYAKDSNGCIDTKNTQILQPNKLELKIDSTNAGCLNQDNGLIFVHAEGGNQNYSYILNEIDTSITGQFIELSTGTYIIEALDSNQCSATDTVLLQIEDTLKLSILSTTNITCFGGNNGEIIAQGSGGNAPYQYVLNGVDTSDTGHFNSLFANTYSVELLDQNACSVLDTINLTEPDSLYLNIIKNDESCLGANDGFINVQATGGVPPYNYIMNDTIVSTTGIFEALLPGTYLIETVDSNDCSNLSSITIEQGTMINVSILESTNIDCFGDSTGIASLKITGDTPDFTIIFDGDTSIVMNGDTFYVDSLYAGKHIYTVENTTNCVVTDSIFITQNDIIELFIDSLQNADCNAGVKGEAYLSAIGGVGDYQFTVDEETSNTGAFLDLLASNYQALVTDSLGCSATNQFTIEQLGGVEIDTTIIENISCFGSSDGSIKIVPFDTSKTYTYKMDSLTNTTGYFGSLSSGDYSVSVIDDQNCEIVLHYSITEPEELKISVIDTSSNNGSITVLAEGGTPPYKYSINNEESFQDSTIFTGLGNGTFIIIVEDANGCTAQVSHVLSSIWDINSQNFDVLIFPQPASNKIKVKVKNSTNEIISYSIYNMSGKLVKVVKESSNDKNIIVLNTSEIKEGVYYLVLRSKNNSFGKSFLIVR